MFRTPVASVPPLAVSAEIVLVAVVAGVLLLAAGGIGLWRLVGKGPRRARAYQRARDLLAVGDWQGVKLAVQEIRAAGIPNPIWAGRINNLEGEGLHRAADASLQAGKYEEALELYLGAAKLLGLSREEATAKVVGGLLGELREQIAHGEDDKALRQARRLLQVRPGHAEALFWLGLASIRQGRHDEATAALRSALENGKGKSVEPAFYLGTHLLRSGQPKEGLKLLAEANKAAGNSVVVSWQLGMGLAMSGGDAGFAIRALQKSLGADGLPKLAKSPETFWRQAFPGESYIAQLTDHQSFVCPILGANLPGMIRQAKLGLGQTLFRADRIAEAADVFQDLINEGEPTVAMLRALGIALCRLERFSEAYPQLRAAFEQETTKSPLTACYLAIAIARARPRTPGDKPLNVREAVRLIVGLAYPIEEEPARLVAAVFAEARSVGLPLPAEDHLRLCNTLIALNIADATAAAAMDHLAAEMPDAIRPAFAFLYGWAARQHDYRGEHDLDLLTMVFQHLPAADAFYQEHGWNLALVERLFLERWSEKHTGFPEVMGPDYPTRCEQALLLEAKQLEEAGKPDQARSVIDLLRRMIPANAATLDQLAKLAWHRGEIDEAERLLQQWAEAEPADATPRLRLAVLEQERDRGETAADHMRSAYDKSTGAARTAAAFLGARLAMKGGRSGEAVEWLNVCLKQDAGHPGALTLLAALRFQGDDRAGLRDMAAAMNRPAIEEPHFRYLSAATHLAIGELEQARDAARPLLDQVGWQTDAHHLLGLIEARLGNWSAAAARLNSAIIAGEGPVADHARAVLGRAKLELGDDVDAPRQWLAVPDEKRHRWGLSDALPGFAYLAGVQSLRNGDELAACEWLGRAHDLGWKDPRLSVLMERAALAEARRLLHDGANQALEPFLPALDKVSRSRGSLQTPAALLLARVHRRRGRLTEAREVLRRITPTTTPVLRELGHVALDDHQLTAAEEIFARVVQDQPHDLDALYNLFWTRLSLGQAASASGLLTELIGGEPAADERRLLIQIQTLMRGGSNAGPLLGDMTMDEEQRLIGALFAVADLEVTVPWMCILAGARSHSSAAREAQTIGMIRLGKQMFDRGDWLGCEKWLGSLAKARPLASIRNLLGCCLCMQQDFASGILHLQEALRLAGDDPRLHQNLALAFAWQGDPQESELCWGRYLGTADKRLPRPPGFIEYHDQLRFQVLRHLGNQAYEQERWSQSLAYLEEARQWEPDNADLCERVFLLQVQAGNRTNARKTLVQLQSLKPRHSPFELYELDLIEVRNGADLERLLDTLAQVVERLIDDPTAQDKAVSRALPQLQARSEQLTRVLRDVREDLQRLPEDSNGWFDALRDLRGIKKDLRRLRQIVRYCTQLQVSNPNRNRLDGLTDELDRKIDYCRRWEELD